MLDVQQLRALCKKATPPPWTADVSEPDDCVVWAAGCVEQCSLVGNVGDTVTPVIQDHEKAQIFFDAEINDCKFIAAAREALPELLDRVETLEKVAEAAILECKDHGDPYQSGHCDCDLCTALRAAGYGGMI